jgi:hypothetical protein
LTHDPQQRAAGRRSWGSSVRAAAYAPHSIVDNQNQSRGIYRARVISLARPGPASVLHLPGLRASAFYRIARRRNLPLGSSDWRLVLVSLRGTGRLKINAQLIGVRSRQSLSDHIKASQAVGPKVFHSSTSFRGVTFQRPNRDTRRIVNVQQAVGEIRNV